MSRKYVNFQMPTTSCTCVPCTDVICFGSYNTRPDPSVVNLHLAFILDLDISTLRATNSCLENHSDRSIFHPCSTLS